MGLGVLEDRAMDHVPGMITISKLILMADDDKAQRGILIAQIFLKQLEEKKLEPSSATQEDLSLLYSFHNPAMTLTTL